MQAGTWPRVAVVGAGAVGCYYGGMLARAGAPVTLIGRRAHMDAIARDGLLLDRLSGAERVRVEVSTGIDAVRGAQIVLVCVKTVDTETVAKELQAQLATGAIVLSLQNGVNNVERMRASAQIDAIPAVVYVAAAMAGPGHVKHSGRGDLVIGTLPHAVADGGGEASIDLNALSAVFERAEIPCRVSQNIRLELWAKMVLNCGYNAISALGRARYGRMAQSPDIVALMRQAIAETIAVARAEGVQLDEAGMIEAGHKLGAAMSEARSSTSQDIERGRPTEIDSLNGYIARRGAELGVPTPVNQMLYALVKLLEQSRDV